MHESSASSFGLLAACLVALALSLSSSTASAGPQDQNDPRDFNELLNLAKRLESAKFVLHKLTDDQQKERVQSVYLFVKATKSPFCDKKYEETLKVASEYKLKAYELVKESKKTNKGWFSNMVGGAFGPIGKLRSISKSDAYLNDITKRYETQSKSALLTEQTVDCDINKFKIKTLHEIMLILQAEIKYLITEPVYVINRAIFDRLKADRFVSESNFYDTHELNHAQRQLLLEFLISRRDTTKMTVGQAEDHYYNPGEYVIGRLLETCQILSQFNELATKSFREKSQVCTDSNLDPLNSLFADQFKSDRFDSTTSFCEQLLGAL